MTSLETVPPAPDVKTSCPSSAPDRVAVVSDAERVRPHHPHRPDQLPASPTRVTPPLLASAARWEGQGELPLLPSSFLPLYFFPLFLDRPTVARLCTTPPDSPPAPHSLLPLPSRDPHDRPSPVKIATKCIHAKPPTGDRRVMPPIGVVHLRRSRPANAGFSITPQPTRTRWTRDRGPRRVECPRIRRPVLQRVLRVGHGLHRHPARHPRLGRPCRRDGRPLRRDQPPLPAACAATRRSEVPFVDLSDAQPSPRDHRRDELVWIERPPTPR